MLAFLIVGLLLSAVQNIRTQPPLNEIAEIPQITASPLHWARQYSLDEMLPFERLNPRFWIGPEYRQAFRQIAPLREYPLTDNNALNVYRTADARESNLMDSADIVGPRERIHIATSDEQPSLGKRDSYLSMCHFKLCNLGRKRRISQGGQTDPVSSVSNTDK